MSAPSMKKLILFIVEGPSDKAYLYPVKKMVVQHFNNRLAFKVTRCDLLVKPDTNYINIEIKVAVAVQEYLELYGLEYSDIKQVIHIVDLDGTFIDQKNVESDPSLLRGQTIYFRDKITNINKDNIINRNNKKAKCLDVLYNLKEINYGTLKTIPYRVYYFSTNIDDYFYGNQNATDEEKKEYSNAISDKYVNCPNEYRNMIERLYCVKGNYFETWDFVKKNNQSLNRWTNFNKFFTEIIDKL